MSSTATCTLDGHLVIIDSWSDAGMSQLADDGYKQSQTYYAYGPAWTSFLADQGATADQTTLQEQLTNDAGTLLQESVGQDPYPVASVDAQQTIAQAVASALDGTLGQTGSGG